MHVVLACGSRSWRDAAIIARVVEDLPRTTILVHGDAEGADTLAKIAARRRGLWIATVPVEDEHWRMYGKSAGMGRNAAMLALGVHKVIAFHDKVSSGTAGTIALAVSRDIPVAVYYEDGTVRNYGGDSQGLF